jgi:hypothetical protein
MKQYDTNMKLNHVTQVKQQETSDEILYNSTT